MPAPRASPIEPCSLATRCSSTLRAAAIRPSSEAICGSSPTGTFSGSFATMKATASLDSERPARSGGADRRRPAFRGGGGGCKQEEQSSPGFRGGGDQAKQGGGASFYPGEPL